MKFTTIRCEKCGSLLVEDVTDYQDEEGNTVCIECWLEQHKEA